MSFSIDLSRAIERAKGKQETVIKSVMLETFSKVVMKSPVDTGRFRANWQTGIGQYKTSTTTDTDISGGSTIGRITAEVQAMKLDGKTIYLVNSLPYSLRLEHGWSKIQAPAGIIKITLAEITAKYGT